GTTYWANAGATSAASLFTSYSAIASPATSLGPVRVLANRLDFFSGVTVFNPGPATAQVDLQFSFPFRASATNRAFTVHQEVAPGAMMLRWLGQPLEATTGSISVPSLDEGGAAGD